MQSNEPILLVVMDHPYLLSDEHLLGIALVKHLHIDIQTKKVNLTMLCLPCNLLLFVILLHERRSVIHGEPNPLPDRILISSSIVVFPSHRCL